MRDVRDSNSEIRIRNATTQDAEAISALLCAAFGVYRDLYTVDAYNATVIDANVVLQRISDGPVWLVLVEDNIAGTVSLVLREKEIYIRGMAVKPEFRGHGIGEDLLRAITAFARDRGCEKLVLSTTPFLLPAIRLYEKCGFQKTNDGPHQLYGTPLFTMVKTLKVHE